MACERASRHTKLPTRDRSVWGVGVMKKCLTIERAKDKYPPTTKNQTKAASLPCRVREAGRRSGCNQDMKRTTRLQHTHGERGGALTKWEPKASTRNTPPRAVGTKQILITITFTFITFIYILSSIINTAYFR